MSSKLTFLHANWPAPAQVKTLITTRIGGHSKHNFAEFNLALHVSDNNSTVAENRQQLDRYLPNSPYWLNQTHSNRVLNLDQYTYTAQDNDYDASFTRLKHQVAAVMTADCLPILLTDTQGSFVAAVHAGWRGLATNIIFNTIQHLHMQTQTMLAYIGPAICQQHFEVGEEVLATFAKLNPANNQFFQSKPGHKFMCNLIGIAKLQLINLGLKAENIYLSQECTYCNSKLFYSYRKQNQTGRFASLIWLD